MKNPIKNFSIRARLMISALAAFAATLFIVIFISAFVSQILRETENSYHTNSELDAFLTQIDRSEAAMESYMEYRTFESIDRYYHYEALAENAAANFHDSPSRSEVRQKEFVIKKLSQAFFDLSSSAIAARRANNSLNSEIYLAKTKECYSFLRAEIVNLNMLYFKLNAARHNEHRINTQNAIRKTILALLVILVCTAALLYINIARITRPLSDISSMALRVAERDFNVPLFKSDAKNEIGNICRAFDSMIISIREYIRTIRENALKENELREKEIEMRALFADAHFKALQDQVQPHFLFNTLNTGAQLAMIEGADRTCFFLEQVADFLRYNIQHPGNDATIGEELGMLDNYIYIMKVRFGERYEFVQDIDQSTLEARIPNTILQPLVENCIKHGLKDVSEKGKITISIKKNASCININISDNGTGFDSETRRKIMERANSRPQDRPEAPKDEKGHISSGLINVISRLQIYFKGKARFEILEACAGSENSCGGTLFAITIPEEK